jgi:hypothetical protein
VIQENYRLLSVEGLVYIYAGPIASEKAAQADKSDIKRQTAK